MSGLKECRGTGTDAWKNARRLSRNLGAAEGEFVTRARARNPLIPARANNLVLIEIDLDVPVGAYPELDEVKLRSARLLQRLGLRFPRTVMVRSRRGLHLYLRPPAGRPPAKVQISEKGEAVAWASDGYVVGVPGLHELAGVVYEYVVLDEIGGLAS
jgi:hypothetical protein